MPELVAIMTGDASYFNAFFVVLFQTFYCIKIYIRVFSVIVSEILLKSWQNFSLRKKKSTDILALPYGPGKQEFSKNETRLRDLFFGVNANFCERLQQPHISTFKCFVKCTFDLSMITRQRWTRFHTATAYRIRKFAKISHKKFTGVKSFRIRRIKLHVPPLSQKNSDPVVFLLR